MAAERGHASILEDLLKRRPNLNAANFEGMNALMLAAREGHPDSVKLLIDGDAELERVNRLGMTALQLAAREGHLENVRLLLAAGANPHHAANNQETALTLASENGHGSVVKLLLERGVDPGHILPDGSTALLKAARFGHWKVVRELLEKGEAALPNHADHKRNTALLLTIGRGDMHSLQTLLSQPNLDLEHTDAEGNTALTVAARTGNLAAVKRLLEKGANIRHANAKGLTALHIASEKGWCQLAKTLIAHEPQPDLNATDATGDTPMKLAARNGHTRLMDLLLYSGGSAERPHTRQFQQLKDYLDGIAAQRGLQTQGGFSDLLGQLALRDNPSAENTTAGPSPESAKLFNLA